MGSPHCNHNIIHFAIHFDATQVAQATAYNLSAYPRLEPNQVNLSFSMIADSS